MQGVSFKTNQTIFHHCLYRDLALAKLGTNIKLSPKPEFITESSIYARPELDGGIYIR